MTEKLTLQELNRLVGKNGAIAVRRCARLLSAGGQDEKVFPATYPESKGEVYLREQHIRPDGERIPCVVLDSVGSQANRMEQALKEVFYHGQNEIADIPFIVADFSKAGNSIGNCFIPDITSLDAPHRMADAIFRDCLLNQVPFPKSPVGETLNTAAASNATDLYKYCPTALIFGMWFSQGERGGLGAKFQRIISSEITGVNVEVGVENANRVDPLPIVKDAGPLYVKSDGSGWTLDEEAARKTKQGKPESVGKEGKPSEVMLGNVIGEFKDRGFTMEYAVQNTVISIPALKRLHFPDDEGEIKPDRDQAAWAALLALAIAGAQFSIDNGCDLRSRCLLIPDCEHPASWEWIGRDGKSHEFETEDLESLVKEASKEAAERGLPAWNEKPIVLQPSPELYALVKKSVEISAKSKEGDDSLEE